MIRTPSFFHSLLCFGVVVLMISTGLFVFEISLHSIIFYSLVWVTLNASLIGYSYLEIQEMMGKAITRALPAIFIFFLIGMVIASYMRSGTIVTLIYYGLELLEPSFFLVTGLLLCCLMSVVTGTSWGTVGTLGVVFIGIGGAMEIPLPIVAGMVISGATFGDKLSPISDTTNLAAMSAETDLYSHIKSMLYTTVPTLVIVIFIMLYFGMQFSEKSLPEVEINTIQAALESHYGINPFITLIPLVIMLVLSMLKYSPQISMGASILVACAIAFFYQGTDFITVSNALWSNQSGATGIESIDGLLGRGGISSMSWTLLLSIMALAMGGVLFEAGFLSSLLSAVIGRVNRAASLVAITISSGFVGNLAMGEAYISIILNCQLFKKSYDEIGLRTSMLSRSVEEGSTLTTGLIPWTTAGAFYAVTLGVPVLEYAPYAFLNYLNPLVSISMVVMGLGLLRQKGSGA
jgi:Na+:H+ antiporter, NhaC family